MALLHGLRSFTQESMATIVTFSWINNNIAVHGCTRDMYSWWWQQKWHTLFTAHWWCIQVNKAGCKYICLRRLINTKILFLWQLFLAAIKQLYEWYFLSVCPSVRPSVCLSVCPSVRLSHLFDYVPIIVSSWNFQELSHWTRVRSMQKVRGQRSRSQRSRPKFSFPDCNSSLNSHMMMKWYI